MTRKHVPASVSKLLHLFLIAVVMAGIALSSRPPEAAQAEGPNAVLNLAGCTANTLGPIDDSPSKLANIGFTVNFFGTSASTLFVNNNGNVTFGSALTGYQPFDLTQTANKIIAPFFADVEHEQRGYACLVRAHDVCGAVRLLCELGQRPRVRAEYDSAGQLPAPAGRALRHGGGQLRHLLQLRQDSVG